MCESGTPVTTGRAPGRYSGCPSPSQSKSQEPGPQLSLWVSQMESLEPADCISVPLTKLTSDEQPNLSFFISKQGQWHVIHMFWEIKPPIYSANVSFLFHSSLTTSGHVLWTRVRKLLRRYSGHWVCYQKQDLECKHIYHTFTKSKRIHFYILTCVSSAFIPKFLD